MNLAVILGLALVVYAFVVIKISLYVKRKYIWKGENLLINKVRSWNLTGIVCCHSI